MADVQKPVAAETPVVEPVAAPAVEEVKPAEPVAETKTEEPTKEVEAEAAAPVEEKKEEKAEEKPVEPIYSGSLGYKAPGLKNAFRFSKKYFWFGEEAVETKNLTEYLRGEKADVAYPTAAWSSQTGKGLLYFAKHADKKETPAGVLKLSEAKELAKDGAVGFHFKLHGGKHSFESSSIAERNSWYFAFEKAIEEAAAAEKEIIESESYKEQLEKLKKPTPHAAVASSSAPKKSTDVAALPTEASAAEETTPVARTGSSSSSSSDEEKKKKKKKSKSKSRSVSRGKRASFFGSFIGKKEKVEEKKEEKKEDAEEKKEEKAEAEEKKEEPAATPALEPAVVPVAPVAESAPVIPEEVVKPEEPVAAEGATETKTEEKKPKPTKRGSIFGTLAQKLKSPTTEKKESEVAPAVPAKDTEAAPEAPKTEEAPVVPEAPVVATEAPKTEEAKPATTPHKEKEHFSFGKFLGKAKSPTTETPPKVEETPKKEATPEPAAAVEATEAPKEEEKKDDAPLGVTSTAAAAPAPKAKRGSIFGNFGGSVKKEKEGESGEKKGLGGLFRNASKSIRPKKEEKAAATPAKVDETAEPKDEKKTEEAPKEETVAEKKTEPATIGDVVPEAVTVGQAPKSTPEVSATA